MNIRKPIWIRVIFGLSLFAIASLPARAGQNQSTEPPLIIWHPFVGKIENLFSQWINDHARRESIHIRLESGFDISTALRKKAGTQDLPDLIIGPSDLLDLAKVTPLAVLDEGDFPERVIHRVGKSTLGVRIFENGRLVFLRKRAESTPGSKKDFIDALAKGKKFAWTSSEPFYMLPFLIGDRKIIPDPLKDYSEFLHGSNMPVPCNHQCLWSSLKNLEADYAVIGDWLLPDLPPEMHSSVYTFESLPSFLGRCASLPHIAFFPLNSNFDKKRFLQTRSIVSRLTSREAQAEMIKSLIIASSVRQENVKELPDWIRPALQNPTECDDVSTLTKPTFWALSSEVLRQLTNKVNSIGAAKDALLQLVNEGALGGSKDD